MQKSKDNGKQGIYRILAINPGSTSTKVAIFENEDKIAEKNLEHSAESLAKLVELKDQIALRQMDIEKYLEEQNWKPEDIDVVAARGCPDGVYKAGAYEIDGQMAADCVSPNGNVHPMSLGPVIAYNWVTAYGAKAYNYDVVRVDELSDVARLSGTPLFERSGASHTLNTKAVARKVARELGKTYESVTFIMCHLGGGIGVNLHQQGRIVDVVGGDEGTFSPVRAGKVPQDGIMKLCFSGNYDVKEISRLLRIKSGLTGYLGTNDCKEVEQRIVNGDEKARLIYEAMAYQTAKDIGSMAAAAAGNVDRIVLTGGIAYSEMLTEMIRKRVSFIAPVVIFPGSMEMEALCQGVLRVLRGEETVHKYKSREKECENGL